MKAFKHIVFIAVFLFMCLGIPFLYFYNKGTILSDVDVVSSASLEVPDQPSGTFYVLVNKNMHSSTLEDWQNFFTEKEVGVIMEDISCLVSKGDVNGKELADRYLARLAENQMKITMEDGALIASKAEAGIFDVIILSTEAAQAYGYDQMAEDDSRVVIAVTGAET